jgi:hypothetical protein
LKKKKECGKRIRNSGTEFKEYNTINVAFNFGHS